MIQIPVSSSSHTYQVSINDSLFRHNFNDILDCFKKNGISRLAFLYDKNCRKYLDTLLAGFERASFPVLTYEFPSGESAKSIDKIYPVFSWLIEQGMDRNSGIAALGGGVTGDAVGFVASVYLRGVPFFQFPTTLLSMVDSSVGGKVAINHELGKNLIGSFYPPLAVYIDTDCLDSLAAREYSCGLAECVKHALLEGESAVNWLEDAAGDIMKRKPETVKKLLDSNIRIKAGIVQEDEKEAGKRAFLNLGHTFAHALEKHFSYSSELLHGEAVSLGLVAAVRLSVLEGLCGGDVLLRLEKLLLSLSLPIRKQNLPVDSLAEIMKRDKKVRDKSIHFVLIDRPGSPLSSNQVLPEHVLSAWNYISE
jgi:3-dehydroquinate synthase